MNHQSTIVQSHRSHDLSGASAQQVLTHRSQRRRHHSALSLYSWLEAHDLPPQGGDDGVFVAGKANPSLGPSNLLSWLHSSYHSWKEKLKLKKLLVHSDRREPLHVPKHAETVNIPQPVASWSSLTGLPLSLWLHRL